MAKKTILSLIDQFEPEVRRAFLQAISEVRSDVQIALLERAIASGNVNEAMRVLSMDASYFRPLEEALRKAHLAGGEFVYSSIKKQVNRAGGNVIGRFDSRNLRAEQILSEWSSRKVVAIAEASREAIRETLTAGIQTGRSPRRLALDLVGRVGTGGKRTGGVVGLDPTKAGWVRNMQADLELGNGDRYFSRKLRDKRFDGAVQKYFKAGKPVPQTMIDRITTRYTGRLERLRGEAIARTELLGSLHAAQAEGLEQIVETGEVSADSITLEWDASSDKFTRDTHKNADGQTRPQGEPFSIGGFPMRYPGDSQYAPAREVVNCRCHLRVSVDFTAGLNKSLTQEERRVLRELM